MKIYLIRHGSTAGNLEHRYVGTTDEPLTNEALCLLEEKKEFYPRPDCVFVSPLVRCVQTAGVLFPDVPPRQIPQLREMDFGEFEYKNYEELKEDVRYQKWIDSNGTEAFPGGESRKTFAGRCCAAFEKACLEAEKESAWEVAFVVHGGTIMAILDRYARPHHDYFEWQVKNGEGFSCELYWDREEEAFPIEKPSCKNEICGEVPSDKEKSAGRLWWAEEASELEDQKQLFYLSEISPLPYAPGMTGIEDEYVMKQNKKLRCGYTTGTCAAAAAKAAAQMLLSGRMCFRADLLTPKGIWLHLPIEEQRIEAGGKPYAECAVRKYAGDDPDATDGIRIYARAEYLKSNDSVCSISDTGARVVIDGGVGVGRVTRPGLEQPVGEAAINRVPREMITREVETVCEAFEYNGRLKITISVPEGVEIAKRTFNPHLGIVGGISILGTSGIVVPMSEEALIASIRVEMKQKVASGEKYILVTPGNYGEDFLRRGGVSVNTRPGNLDEAFSEKTGICHENMKTEPAYSLSAEDSMKCSNYVGETLDIAQELGAEGILFVAHIGKFIKVSGGIMNTHSAHADCRAELIAAQAMRAGAPPETVRKLLDTNTTEEAVSILLEAGWLEPTMAEVTSRIHFHLQKHCKGALQTEAIIYSSQYGYLGETDGAGAIVQKIAQRNALLASDT